MTVTLAQLTLKPFSPDLVRALLSNPFQTTLSTPRTSGKGFFLPLPFGRSEACFGEILHNCLVLEFVGLASGASCAFAPPPLIGDR